MLQSLPVPESAWQVISLDFAEGLPLSDNYNCVLVVVDLLTKYNHFIPLRHPFTMVRVAKAFFHSVYHLHGLPSAIILDCDRIFTSHFWTELFKLADVKLCRSTVIFSCDPCIFSTNVLLSRSNTRTCYLIYT